MGLNKWCQNEKNQIALLAIALGFWLIALPLTFHSQYLPMKASDLASGFLLIIFGLYI